MEGNYDMKREAVCRGNIQHPFQAFTAAVYEWCSLHALLKPTGSYAVMGLAPVFALELHPKKCGSRSGLDAWRRSAHPPDHEYEPSTPCAYV